MGDCRHCGETAGFLRGAHSECAKRYNSGRRAMVARTIAAATGRNTSDNLPQELFQIASANFVPPAMVRATMFEGLKRAVAMSLEDGLLTREEEESLRDYARRFHLERGVGTLALDRLTRGAVLREVCEGKLPDDPHRTDNPPFNFQKSEKPVWTFFNVGYYERRTRRIRQGSSSGVGVRVMRGVYYSPRSFRSESIEHNVTERVDTGTVGITDKHVYFKGTEKSFRVPYSRIVSFDATSDGFSLVRDAANARPQIFITGDGWFSYNLVTNLAKER